MRHGADGHLRRVFGLYTLGFLGFVLLLAGLEQLGLSNRLIGILFVVFTVGLYAVIGYASRTIQVGEFYVAGRKVPAIYNGMATAADWMSAASFIGLAGTLYAFGYDGLAYVLGWTGGFVLVAVLIAPYLRKFGAYTVTDFLGVRYGGNAARLVGLVAVLTCSFTYLVAQVYGTGLIASRFLQIPFEVAVFFGLAGILLCSAPGGMRAVTWTQVAQYIVLIVAYVVPVALLSIQTTGLPIPQLAYGEIMGRIGELELTAAPAGTAPLDQPFATMSPLNFFGLIFCLMIGTASLPHVLMRFFTTSGVKQTRRSVGWALLFIAILYVTAPAYAVFARYAIHQGIVGADVSTVAAAALLPDWVYIYGELGLVRICDAFSATPQALVAACGPVGGTIAADRFWIDGNALVIAMPEIAGLPYVIAGLVAAGGLAAALSTADGLLLAISNAVSHDVYYRIIDPAASSRRRLMLSRLLLVVVAVVAAAMASLRPGGILEMVSWAFSLAGAGLFPALVLGIWWRRATAQGAIAGMLLGGGLTAFYLAATRFFGMPLWFGIDTVAAGLIGIPVGFAAIIAVSLATPVPDRQIQDFISELRVPRGRPLDEAPPLPGP